MPEVVGAELQLEPVGCGLSRHHHHARVVHQQVERTLPLLGEGAYRGEVGEVERPPLRAIADAAGGLAALVGIATRDHDRRAVAGQLGGRHVSDAAVRTRDHGGTAGLVGDVVGGPVRHVRNGTVHHGRAATS